MRKKEPIGAGQCAYFKAPRHTIGHISAQWPPLEDSRPHPTSLGWNGGRYYSNTATHSARPKGFSVFLLE
ncbi:hypothetical protein E2562_001237 [Oryza meyeriana var. granulata]|uniref:Uncharacterized protein n=1 Tax=Oryza meyeriana var. granulata TaxID=110450 RepID=A0A6G1DBZ8_9ORYZ|nr:hypothetical protein E2562_001237 [Oryza meyeriana var. granulata]